MTLPSALLLVMACVKTPGTPAHFITGTPADRTPLAELCDDPTMTDKSFCMPASLERQLRRASVEFLDGEVFGTGASGIMKMRVRLEDAEGDSVVVDTKWKPGPKSFSGLNNSPRKEVAAYEVQKLFMPPERRVVPPTVFRCAPLVDGMSLDDRSGGKALPCVLGTLSLWVDNIEAPVDVDQDRMRDDLAYRTAIADLNILMHVISHRDTHKNNWYMSTDPERVRSVSVDNGVAFSGFRNYFVRQNWAKIHVPAVPADTIERLRKVTRADLEALRTLGAWQVTESGLEPVDDVMPASRGGIRFDKDAGLLVQGLSDGELDGVQERIEELVEDVDEGRLATFEPPSALAVATVEAE